MLESLSKKRLQHRCFPVDIAKFLRTAFYRTPLVAASGPSTLIKLNSITDNYDIQETRKPLNKDLENFLRVPKL